EVPVRCPTVNFQLSTVNYPLSRWYTSSRSLRSVTAPTLIQGIQNVLARSTTRRPLAPVRSPDHCRGTTLRGVVSPQRQGRAHAGQSGPDACGVGGYRRRQL